MSNVTIMTHFSEPNWPVVNKLSAICKCLEVDMVHCSSVAYLMPKIKEAKANRILLFTDEGLVDTIQELGSAVLDAKLEVAVFFLSNIATAAKKINTMPVVKYLIGMEQADLHGRDLSILVKKFADGDILDLEKYLAFGSKINSIVVNSSESRRTAIDAVSSYILRLGDPGYFHPYGEYSRKMAELTDELLLNAVYNANPRMKDCDRSLPYLLEKHEEVKMSWGYDGEYFGVSVRDPFGSFNSETIMNYISSNNDANQILASKSAGLGLKIIFEKAHQVVTNVKNEKVTEVIVLVKLLSRMLDFENQKKSFYFFNDSDGNKKKIV